MPRTYAELRREVERVVVAGRRSIEVAWVRTYHETGRLIHEHLLLNENRADYGARVFVRLATETEISRRTLYECVQFYRCFPNVRVLAQLAWNHCRLLCQVSDPKQREALLGLAKKEQWTTAALETRIRERNAAGEPAPAAADRTVGPARKILKPRRGVPGLFRVVARDDRLAVDAGFKLYFPVAPAAARGLSAGVIARWEDGGDPAPAQAAAAADLFTYRATVRRVLDGDTLAVMIALPYCQMDEKLRLRGLDCPEMDTPEGKAAKRFTELLLADAAEVIIATSKVDKYDRYLADVHVRRPTGEEVFLNNALLENGHAVPMGAEEMTDWTP
jgi:endonuclease YncB( thermonuclease family)